ncbi:MAG TPA: hypothetical protein VJ750_06005 [Rhizomicrobium sp.]|nr:hypothetical protein [Rhizomicrobium sp.]
MPNTLDWVGDGDDVATVGALEQAFEIAFSNAELEVLKTVGDLHGLVLHKISRSNGTGKCASAMAFYRLRRALAANRPEIRITPATEMAVFSAPSLRYFFRRLSEQTGLRLPGPPHTWVGNIGEACWLLPLMGALPLLAWSVIVRPEPYVFVGLVGVFILGLILVRLDPGRLTGTVGALAREAARANYGNLLKQGARGRDAEIWGIFIEILADESRLNPREITRETVFFRSQLEAA